MKLPKWHYTLALLLVLLSPALVFAEKRYISDTLIVSLRDEASLRGNIISYLRSGDSLEIIEEHEDGFILVQTATGDQGWIQKKYTIDEKPKDLIIADLEKTVTTLKAQIKKAAGKTETLKATSQNITDQLRDKDQEIASLRNTISELTEAVKRAEGKYTDLRQKSQGVEEIFAERDALLARLKTVDQEVAMLRVENAELIQTERLLWFLAGFGVFLVGWIMGKVSRKSRRSGLSL